MSGIDSLYHAAPLQYLPSILACGALLPSETLTHAGIAARRTAERRDRKLGLHSYVHLALRNDFPLLAHKVQLGYPHALFVFHAEPVRQLPGAGLLRYDGKAWRHRDDYIPVHDTAEQDRLMAAYGVGRRSGLAIVVPGPVPLNLTRTLAFIDSRELALVEGVVKSLDLPQLTAVAQPQLFPKSHAYSAVTLTEIAGYFEACAASGSVLPPPPIAFD